MMTETSALDLFGKTLIQEVRDRSIETMEWSFMGTARAPYQQELMAALHKLDPTDRDLCFQAVLLAVDHTLAKTLDLFEEGETDYAVALKNDHSLEDISTTSDGLQGELYTEEGWVARLSKKEPSILTK